MAKTKNLAKFREALARPASRMLVGGFRPPENPLASWFGRVKVGLPEETWPLTQNGLMLPLCQINCTELPYQPENLKDIALITVFIDNSTLPTDTPAKNGDGWLLRTYAILNGLVKLQTPPLPNSIKPFPVRWERIAQDFPDWQTLAEGQPLSPPITKQEMTRLANLESYAESFPNQMVSKIGGWPSSVQSAAYFADSATEYVFQIDSEEKADWQWGDAGIGWFGRKGDEWCLNWACY